MAIQKPTSSAATNRAIIEEYLGRMAGNIVHLKMTELQRELLKAALRTLIRMTPP